MGDLETRARNLRIILGRIQEHPHHGKIATRGLEACWDCPVRSECGLTSLDLAKVETEIGKGG